MTSRYLGVTDAGLQRFEASRDFIRTPFAQTAEPTDIRRADPASAVGAHRLIQ
jgi:hypothetical protein